MVSGFLCVFFLRAVANMISAAASERRRWSYGLDGSQGRPFGQIIRGMKIASSIQKK